jgi:thiosulfate/3-mercaptopyruvate sulfurtransferase
MPETYVRPELLTEPSGVVANVKNPQLRILDLRSEGAYAEAHVPGALRLAEGFLRSTRDKETYLPMGEEVAQILRTLGVGEKTQIVAYDDRNGMTAARLWYVLNVYGFTRVSLLHGGWKRWASEKLPTSRESGQESLGAISVRTASPLSCPSSEVLKRRPGVITLDSRSPDEFAESHLPGAVNVEWRENLMPDGLLFKPQSQLRRLYESKGVTPDKEIITYCGVGARAAVSLFALHLIGYKKARLYYGSFNDYTARPNAPLERGNGR